MTAALCVTPLVAVMAAAGPAVLVREKVTAGAEPGVAVTCTVNPPALVFAVNVAEATPLELVCTVVVVAVPPNVPLGAV